MFNYNTLHLTGNNIAQSEFSSTMTGGLSQSLNPLYTDYKTKMLEGFIEPGSSKSSDKLNLNDLYREIYLLDTVCGPTVDLMCNLPWSEYYLTGISDNKVLSIYEDCLNELELVQLMIQLSVSFLVLGEVIGSLIFNESKGIFTDIINQNPDDCEITPIPLRGYDPRIDLKVSKEIKDFLNSRDPRDLEAKKELPPKLLQKFMSGTKVPLEPLSTLYLARSFVPGIRTVSYYHRVLPIWLIEKALMRGTIIAAWRRQRSILHVTAGSEAWDPTPQQLEEITRMFINADNSPQGGVVTTKPEIQTNEVRDGSNFWKITDETDSFTSAKMRAMQINEGFLSGDSNFNTMEVSLSVFMDNLRTFRTNMTDNVLNDKIFTSLAKVHGFVRRSESELTHRIRINGSKHTNSNEYIIPKVKWAKDLKARYDENYLSILSTAEEKGIPVPLVMYANAAGLTRDEIVGSLEDDINFRKDIKKYNDKLKEQGLKKEEPESDMFSSERIKKSNVKGFIPITDKMTNKQITNALKEVI